MKSKLQSSCLKLAGAMLAFSFGAVSAFGAPARPQLKVTGYVIDAELDPANNKLPAPAKDTFTALEDLTAPMFELNNGLALSSVTDAANQPLTSERLTPQNAVRFTLSKP